MKITFEASTVSEVRHAITVLTYVGVGFDVSFPAGRILSALSGTETVVEAAVREFREVAEAPPVAAEATMTAAETPATNDAERVEGKPKGERFRRTKEEIAAGLTVEQAMAARAAAEKPAAQTKPEPAPEPVVTAPASEPEAEEDDGTADLLSELEDAPEPAPEPVKPVDEKALKGELIERARTRAKATGGKAWLVEHVLCGSKYATLSAVPVAQLQKALELAS